MVTSARSDGPDPLGTGPDGRLRFPRFPQLDGFRGIAILLVLVEHALRHSLGLNGPWNHLGGAGVQLFFVLSGFLITGLLCAEESRTQAVNVVAFYVRRALRILPAFYVFLAVVALLKGAGLVTSTRWLDLVEALLFVRNLAGRDSLLAHAWSLSIEQQFYLVWPWLFWGFGAKGAWKAGWGILVGVVVWRSLASGLGVYPPDSPVFYLRTDFRLDALMAGSLFAIWRHARPGWSLRWSGFGSDWWPAALALGFLGWSAVGQRLAGGEAHFLTGSLVFASLLLTHLILYPASGAAALCRSTGLCWLGRYSYSIYLWQQLFLVAKIPEWGAVLRFPLDLILALVAGVTSYHLIEQPFIGLKLRWARS